jgi:hypothetical protein
MLIKTHLLRADDYHTLSQLTIDGTKQCLVLEDPIRPKKIPKETAIPSGRYSIGLRKYGGFYKRALATYGAAYMVGFPEIEGVPGFSDVLIHTGNGVEDTAGCLLVGNLYLAGTRRIKESSDAWRALYVRIRAAWESKVPIILEHRHA